LERLGFPLQKVTDHCHQSCKGIGCDTTASCACRYRAINSLLLQRVGRRCEKCLTTENRQCDTDQIAENLDHSALALKVPSRSRLCLWRSERKYWWKSGRRRNAVEDGINGMTMTSFPVRPTFYGHCCRRHVVGQRIVICYDTCSLPYMEGLFCFTQQTYFALQHGGVYTW